MKNWRKRKDSVVGYWKFEDDVSVSGDTIDRSKTNANITYTTSGRPSQSQQTPESKKYIQKNTALFNSSHGIIANPSGNSLSFDSFPSAPMFISICHLEFEY